VSIIYLTLTQLMQQSICNETHKTHCCMTLLMMIWCYMMKHHIHSNWLRDQERDVCSTEYASEQRNWRHIRTYLLER